MEFINTLLPALEHFRMLGYWVVLLFSLLESLAFVGVVVPGAVVVVFAGSLAAKGYFDLGDLAWFASAGAILGDGISFRLGKGEHIRFREENRIFKPGLLEKGKDFFARHGGKSVFLGRVVGPIRAVIPFVAGVSGMEAKRFYLWNITSAISWAGTHLLADTMMKMLGPLLSNKGHPTAPVPPSFWNGHVNDLSFVKATPARTLRERHQARLWKADIETSDGRAVYVGTAVFDSGLKWQVVYRIGPDLDAEREGLLRELLAAGVVASSGWSGFVPPMTGRNSFGDPYFPAGNLVTIYLK